MKMADQSELIFNNRNSLYTLKCLQPKKWRFFRFLGRKTKGQEFITGYRIYNDRLYDARAELAMHYENYTQKQLIDVMQLHGYGSYMNCYAILNRAYVSSSNFISSYKLTRKLNKIFRKHLDERD